MALSYSILKLKNYRLLLSARFCSMMALHAQAVIIGWQIYSLTKDPFLLGLVGLVEAVPAIIMAFFAGHIVDNASPRRIFILAMLGLTLNTALLWWVGSGHAGLAPDLFLIALYVFAFISGLIRAFIMPASFALLSRIIPREQMSAATAWNSSATQSGMVFGPALAGAIYALYGAAAAWIIPVTLFAIGISCALRLERFEILPQQGREPAFKSIKAGLVFLVHNPVLLSVMALDMFSVLFGGATAMLPAYADQILHVGAEGLGALRAAPAIGVTLTGIYFALKPMKVLSAKRLLWVVACFGVTMIAFGLSTSFFLSMLLLMLSGAFDCVNMIIRGTIMQLLTPDAMKGRISSVNSMFIISSNEIGAFESGVAARALGLVPSVVFGGCMTLVVVAATALLSPTFRRTVIDPSRDDRAQNAR